MTDAQFPAMDFTGARATTRCTTARASGTVSPSCPGSGIDDTVAGFDDGGRARHRRPHRVGHVRRCPGRLGLRPQRPRARRRPLRVQARTGWPGCAPTSTPTTTRPSRSSCAATGTSRPTTATCGAPRRSRGRTHVTPPERDALADVKEWGLVDVFRERYDADGGLFTYWDYRAGDFHKKRGMRIDYVLASTALAKESVVRPGRPQRPQGPEAVRPRAGAGAVRPVRSPS